MRLSTHLFLFCSFSFFIVCLIEIIGLPRLNMNFYPEHHHHHHHHPKEKYTNLRTIPTQIYNNEFCIAYHFLNSTENFRKPNETSQPITLSTHGTSDVMALFESRAYDWDGPISIGLFLDFYSSRALEYLEDVHRCDKEFGKKVSIHFAFRIAPFQDNCLPVKLQRSNKTCEEFLKNRNNYRKEVAGPFQVYPINLMRNMARNGSQSDLHFIMDGDMVPSKGFATKVRQIANKVVDGKSKRVLVIRRFESNVTKIPTDHHELKKMMDKKLIYEFHHKFFYKGHKIANLTHWFHVSDKSTEVTSWEIPYLNVFWEVQPIIHRNDLYNDDYFPARIKDMTSLLYKLCRAEYTFHLVSHVFDVHRGVKISDSTISKAVIAHQKAYIKKKAATRFDKEMKVLYPNTQKKCGRFIY